MDDQYAGARERIAAQRGELRGWRPLTMGDVAVVALQVLGVVRGAPGLLGLRVIVAGATPEALNQRGLAAAERALRRRAVLAEDDAFVVEHLGALHEGSGDAGDDPLMWPWLAAVIHVPERRLPAIAGLATDTVPR